jgi:hypothetical protein
MPDQWSYRGYTALEAKEIPDGMTIRGGQFGQEHPETHIFREDMTGVTFVNCNLDNVFIPPGNTVVDCRQRIFEAQTDGNDWELDPVTRAPMRPLIHKLLTKRGITLPDPVKLPAKRVKGYVDYINGGKL